MRIMGLDFGSKRIGVAISDEMGWTAQGITTLQRKGTEEDIKALSLLVKDYRIDRLVIGLPLNMNGSTGPQAAEILSFVKELNASIGIPVATWDERLSTRAAHKTLLLANTSRKKRKRVIDKIAATFILQGYLDHLSRERKDKNGS